MNRITCLAAVALFVLGATAPAAADETVHQDPAGDVIDRLNVPPYTESVKPGDTKRDITSIRTKYADEKLKVTITLRELSTDYSLYTRILVPSGDTYIVTNHDEPGTSEDTLGLYLYPAPRVGATTFRGGPPLECYGLKAVRIPDKERIRTVIPRACLGSPETVRTGAFMHAFLDNNHSRSDDARRNADIEPTDVTQTRVGSAVAYN